MKKYRILRQGETILVGDEREMENGFEAVENEILGMGVREAHERHGIFRRPVPHSGKVQFLMHVSILVPVIVNCDGKSQEEIEVDAGCLAVQKILGNPTQYIHLENIDWDGSRVDDDECQPARYPAGCEPENGYGESKDNGETGFWMVFRKDDGRLRVERIDEPFDHDPLASDKTAWELAKMAGYELDDDGYVVKSPKD